MVMYVIDKLTKRAHFFPGNSTDNVATPVTPLADFTDVQKYSVRRGHQVHFLVLDRPHGPVDIELAMSPA
jgi:hypothetical protein